MPIQEERSASQLQKAFHSFQGYFPVWLVSFVGIITHNDVSFGFL